MAISTAYASHCLASAARLGVPRLPHPPPLAPHQQPGGRLRICYVSSDFGNHPLSHLMGNGTCALCFCVCVCVYVCVVEAVVVCARVSVRECVVHLCMA